MTKRLGINNTPASSAYSTAPTRGFQRTTSRAGGHHRYLYPKLGRNSYIATPPITNNTSSRSTTILSRYILSHSTPCFCIFKTKNNGTTANITAPLRPLWGRRYCLRRRESKAYTALRERERESYPCRKSSPFPTNIDSKYIHSSRQTLVEAKSCNNTSKLWTIQP